MFNKDICNNKRKLILLIILLCILVFLYGILIFFNYKSLDKYNSVVLPGIYIDEFDMSGYSNKRAMDKIDFYNDYILSKKLDLEINKENYQFSFNDLGISVDKDKTMKKIWDYQKSLSYSRTLQAVNKRSKKKFTFTYSVDREKLRAFLNGLKSSVDVSSVDGYFDTTSSVKYVNGSNGYSLNVDESVNYIVDYLSKGDFSKLVKLVGDEIPAKYNESYSSIDTLTSSFVTNFNIWEGTRPINLRMALNYINGAIVEPGDVFSYYKYAGPYDKSGYVFYYEFVGNGVCQIATTVYNAVLLGGLEVVKRYPHAKKSVYVDGGLDATVASYSSGWNVDFQFRNTYKYPIYIKAYAVGGEAHVEFWSNSNAKEGKTYTTESVQIGRRGYTTYLHTFYEGSEIDKKKIATTWYSEE